MYIRFIYELAYQVSGPTRNINNYITKFTVNQSHEVVHGKCNRLWVCTGRRDIATQVHGFSVADPGWKEMCRM